MRYINLLWSLLFVGLIPIRSDNSAAAPEEKKISIVVEEGETEKAWLGIHIKDLTGKLRQELDSKARYGAVVDEVVDNSPADEAGLQPGDVIVKMDNKTIRRIKDLTDELAQKKPEDEVNLEVMRGQDRLNITVILGKRARQNIMDVAEPGLGFRFPGFSAGAPLGVDMQTMDENLAEYFHVDEDAGVLVTKVWEDGPAQKAGLRSGDILTAIDGEQISDTQSVIDILGEYNKGDTIEISYIRKGKRQTTKITLEERPFSFRSFKFPRAGVNVFPLRNFQFDKNIPGTQPDRHIRPFKEDEIREELQKAKKEYQRDMEKMRQEMDKLREELKKLKNDQ